jgi:hypothetical protein
MSPEINQVFTNLLTFLRSADSQPPAELKLAAGQVLQARVVSLEDGLYLLQSGESKFYAKAESALEIGRKVLLEVLGQKDGAILLKRLEQAPEQAEKTAADPVKLLLKKYGLSAEKDILRVQEALQEIPYEKMTAARYLLDPHLMAALLFPSPAGPEELHKFEIYGYKNSPDAPDVYEVALELELERLGHVEISLKAVEGLVFTRIWAASPEASATIKTKIAELGEYRVELIPAALGPLIVRDVVRGVDIRI